MRERRVDASQVNTDLIGHSYYGDNRSITSCALPVGKRFGLFDQLNKQRLLYWVPVRAKYEQCHRAAALRL